MQLTKLKCFISSTPQTTLLFWLYHAGLDRLRALWQEEDLKCLRKVDGTMWTFDMNGFTLDTPVWIGFSAPDQPVRAIVDTTNRDGNGILCYKYKGRGVKDYY
jgi:tyrosinase